jgi:hypothetical protein
MSLYKRTEKKTLLVVVPNKKEIKIGTPHWNFKTSESYKRRISRFIEKIKEKSEISQLSHLIVRCMLSIEVSSTLSCMDVS